MQVPKNQPFLNYHLFLCEQFLTDLFSPLNPTDVMGCLMFCLVCVFRCIQEATVTEYLNSKNLTEAVSGVRDMKAPKHFLPEMLSKIIVCSLDRPDEDKEHASTLIHTLRTEGLITGENFMQVQTYPCRDKLKSGEGPQS